MPGAQQDGPIGVAAAMQRIERAMPRRAAQTIRIADAAGKILAADVSAERDQPPFDRVMMDGIAIRHAAFAAGTTRFRRQGIQAAGAPRQSLDDPANCIEIMTGAVLPDNTDCIVPIEQLTLTDQHAELNPGTVVRETQFIHHAGSDYRSNQILLAGGTRIGGPEMAVLASAGPADVIVAAEPAVAIIAVGDELIDPGIEIGPSQIRRSNDFAIEALLHGNGLANTAREKLPDDPATLRSGIEKTLRAHEVVVLTGGVSMGKYDYIPAIMQELGVEILLHKVLQKPGRPMWVGRRDDRMVFALPGNPVSALVCARRYVIPATYHSMGHTAPVESIGLGQDLNKDANMTWFVPVNLRQHGSGMVADPRTTNTSGDFHTLAGTTGFVELPAGQDQFPAGYSATLWRW